MATQGVQEDRTELVNRLVYTGTTETDIRGQRRVKELLALRRPNSVR